MRSIAPSRIPGAFSFRSKYLQRSCHRHNTIFAVISSQLVKQQILFDLKRRDVYNDGPAYAGVVEAQLMASLYGLGGNDIF